MRPQEKLAIVRTRLPGTRDARATQRRQTRTISFFLGELSAGSFGCGKDFVETRIAAQRIPARIELEIAVWQSGRNRRDNFELLELSKDSRLKNRACVNVGERPKAIGSA